MLLKKGIFARANMTLTLNLQTLLKITAHPLTIDTVGEVRARLDKGERRYALNKDFICYMYDLNLRPRNMV